MRAIYNDKGEIISAEPDGEFCPVCGCQPCDCCIHGHASGDCEECDGECEEYEDDDLDAWYEGETIE